VNVNSQDEYQKLLERAGGAIQCFWLALWEQNLVVIEESVKYLGEKVWDLRDSTSGRSALDWCVFLHRHDSLRALIALGALPDSHAERYQAPLIQACQSHCEVCLSILIQGGADLNQVEESTGTTALISSSNLAHEKHACHVVDILIQAGADIDQITSAGYFALGAFAIQDYAQCIHALTQAHANTELHAGDGFTALFYAADHGSFKAAEALLRAGADVKALTDWEGQKITPLEWGRQRGHVSLAALLFAFEQAAALRACMQTIAPNSLKPVGSSVKSL
jgi:ankyrin repeat protein